ncbi:vanadium-dependent haloperoxidase [Verrucomicrobiaceae bacterium 227]
MSDLEWDVKIYLTLNGALHDSAIAAWHTKVQYDYVRPITSVRHLGELGQSSDPEGPSYHPNGLPLSPGLVEVVTSGTSAAGQRHEGLAINSIAIMAWRGESAEGGGVGWIPATEWIPYQRSTFVTPAFAGYVSGHSTFSRAAAEDLSSMTGSSYFPGGLGQHTISAGSLQFEDGPDEAIELQWATYFDAADQAGLSRIYGGIHVEADDLAGRIIGAQAGRASVGRALELFDGSALASIECAVATFENSTILTWPCLADFQYQVQSSPDLDPANFTNLTSMQTYSGPFASYTDPVSSPGKRFYRIVRLAP